MRGKVDGGAVEVYAYQLLNDKFGLRDGKDLMESVQLYLYGVESRRLKYSLDSLGASHSLQSIEMFQNPVVSYFCALHWDYSVLSQVQ